MVLIDSEPGTVELSETQLETPDSTMQVTVLRRFLSDIWSQKALKILEISTSL